MSTPAFTPLSPSRLSPSPRRRVLKAARDRGWLLAPSFRQVAENSLAALRAGTLPEVVFLPVPSPTPSPTHSHSSHSVSPRRSYSSVSPDTSPSSSNVDSHDIDSLCHGLQTALHTTDFGTPSTPHSFHTPTATTDEVDTNEQFSTWATPSIQTGSTPPRASAPTRSHASSDNLHQLLTPSLTCRTSTTPRTPSPVRSEADSDDLDELATRTVTRRRAARRRAPSPVQSEADSDDLDELATRTVTRRRAARRRTPSPVRSEADDDDLDELVTRTVRRRRAAAIALESPPALILSDSEHDEDTTQCTPSPRRARTEIQAPPVRGEEEHENDVDELCRRIQTRLRFPIDQPPTYESFDVDKENGLLPALKGAGQWLGLAPLPFHRLRARAADKLLTFFDKEVFEGRLVLNATAKEKVTVAWSGRLTKTAGVTRMKRLPCGKRTAAIELSEKVVDEPARLYNTLAHELAHAATWIFDDCYRPPHGKQFKRWASEFTKWDNRLVITTCHEYEIRYKFKYTCMGCGQVYGRHSRSIDTSKKVCGRCRGALELAKEF